MLAAMLNGVMTNPSDPAIHVDDRGLLYGDGLFETMLLYKGRVRFLDDHLQRLHDGCARLNIEMPDATSLRNELQQVIGEHQNGVLKLILTRGRGGRGYRAPEKISSTGLWQLFAP